MKNNLHNVILLNLHANDFQLLLQNMDRNTGDNWFIHLVKHHKENIKPWRLKQPCEYFSKACKYATGELYWVQSGILKNYERDLKGI